MKKPFLYLLAILFILFSQKHVPVASASSMKEKRQLKKQNNDKLVCVDVADFFYEIIAGVTTFPQQGDCSQKEEAEISAFLQKAINNELRRIPGTIKTQNRVCPHPINGRRRLSTLPGNGSFYNDIPMTSNTTSSQYYAAESAAQDERDLRHKRRSFIYVGGGRCRFCFFDNTDFRLLSSTASTTMDELLPTSTNANQSFERYDRRRNLLFMSVFEPKNSHYPTVADILLCKDITKRSYSFGSGTAEKSFRDIIKWINPKTKKLPVLNSNSEFVYSKDLVGPYVAGDSFGLQMDISHVMKRYGNRNKNYIRNQPQENMKLVTLPVQRGSILFTLYAFDVPTSKSSYDDPLIMFINGIKLDFKLLKSQPGSGKSRQSSWGRSFAGIHWRIIRWKKDIYGHKNLGFGPQPDETYSFFISAPPVVLAHKNRFDVDFIIQSRPNMAKRYAISNFDVSFAGGRCKVTDLENSPFQDFQSVVESRLFHKLGVELANEFQGKKGHCFYDKIPIVNVNLVEKKDWKESKPQCGQ